jgi:hypothetical protein
VIEYESAPPEENLRAARRLLANLYAPVLPVAGEGECDDCGKTRILLELGKVEVCGACAEHRRKSYERAAA